MLAAPDGGGSESGGSESGGSESGGSESGGSESRGTVSGGTVSGGTVSGGTVSLPELSAVLDATGRAASCPQAATAAAAAITRPKKTGTSHFSARRISSSYPAKVLVL